MSFRFAIPSLAPGEVRPHPHREDEQGPARPPPSPQRGGFLTRPNTLESNQHTSSNSVLLYHPSSEHAETPLSSTPAPQRRNVVTPDPVAFRYLEDDRSVSVVERRAVLEGYELYLVEQWACSRQSPTLVITTYTGDPDHSVVVGVLAVPADEKDWSPRLRVYFKAMQQYHARPKETPFGELMATNLSSFPSALTVIAVPDGDFRLHRQDFIVNEDLKRLGCSGRSALTLANPTRATQEKFQSLYKTSDRIAFDESVLEMIKMCQTALFIFGMLEAQYIDGLLCDVTEKAINDWWTEVGVEYYNAEPTDGILGPTTVAALLGMLMGARNRLAWYGAPVTKDVFDIGNMKKGIGSFQKTFKMERTRRLDHQALRKLHSVSAKAAAGEVGWGVQKAVKSTVEGFGGKRGELMIGMVGGKDRGNIGDIETLDIDKFVSLIYGERPKWLWHGKARRSATTLPPAIDQFHERAALPDVGQTGVGRDEVGGQPTRRAQSAPMEGDAELGGMETDGAPQKKDDRISTPYSAASMGSTVYMSESPGDRDKDPRRRTVFKSVAGKVSDARSGFGRIRDGLRGHASRPSRDDIASGGALGAVTAMSGFQMGGIGSPEMASMAQSSSSISSPAMVGRAFTWKNKPEEYLNGFRRDREKESGDVGIQEVDDEDSDFPRDKGPDMSDAENKDYSSEEQVGRTGQPPAGEASVADSDAGLQQKDVVLPSAAASAAGETDLQGPFVEAERTFGTKIAGLLRRHSIAEDCQTESRPQPGILWQRRLSFSIAEEAILDWEPIIPFLSVDVLDDEEEEEEGDVDEDDEKTIPTDDEKVEKTESDETVDKAAVVVASKEVNMASETSKALSVQRCIYERISELKQQVAPLALGNVMELETLDAVYAQQLEEVQTVFFQLTDAYERVQESSQELLAMERGQATEAVREIEMLMAKVEYEIGALESKVQDVEEGVRQFAKQVEDLEKRSEELKQQLQTESWLHWFVRTMTGVGTGPNIVEGPPLASRKAEKKGKEQAT